MLVDNISVKVKKIIDHMNICVHTYNHIDKNDVEIKQFNILMSDISYDKIESNKILGLFRAILDYTRIENEFVIMPCENDTMGIIKIKHEKNKLLELYNNSILLTDIMCSEAMLRHHISNVVFDINGLLKNKYKNTYLKETNDYEKFKVVENTINVNSLYIPFVLSILTTKYFCVSPYINNIEFYVDSFNKPFTIEDLINSSVERFYKLYIEPYINAKGNNICY